MGNSQSGFLDRDHHGPAAHNTAPKVPGDDSHRLDRYGTRRSPSCGRGGHGFRVFRGGHGDCHRRCHRRRHFHWQEHSYDLHGGFGRDVHGFHDVRVRSVAYGHYLRRYASLAVDTLALHFNASPESTYTSEFVLNLPLLTLIASSEIRTASHHTAGLPLLMRIAHGITEDAVASRLVELTALLVAAAFGVLMLIAVVFGGENALFAKTTNISDILVDEYCRRDGESHLIVVSEHGTTVVISVSETKSAVQVAAVIIVMMAVIMVTAVIVLVPVLDKLSIHIWLFVCSRREYTYLSMVAV